MANNTSLHAAFRAKNDEFYTQMPDIANELKHYRQHFEGKTVFCNCDDPYESNFFKFFALNFNAWGLKKLMATCYDGSPVAGQELQLDLFGDDGRDAACRDVACRVPTRNAHKIVITAVPDLNGDGAVDMFDVELLLKNDKNVLTKLNGNGDFRSPECVELLQEADIVVTNPPFSLFREYVAQLVKFEKKFLIIGNVNAFICKELFPLVKDNKMWLGYYNPKEFAIQKLINKNCYTDSEGKMYAKFGNICWYTNLDHNKRHDAIDLYKNYTPESYPKYDNYDAINVDKTADIPMDYDGVMGVPLTFIGKYCPSQFEIIWQASGNTRACAPNDILKEVQYRPHPEDRGGCPILNGKRTFTRILIRRRRSVKYEIPQITTSIAAERTEFPQS